MAFKGRVHLSFSGSNVLKLKGTSLTTEREVEHTPDLSKLSIWSAEPVEFPFEWKLKNEYSQKYLRVYPKDKVDAAGIGLKYTLFRIEQSGKHTFKMKFKEFDQYLMATEDGKIITTDDEKEASDCRVIHQPILGDPITVHIKSFHTENYLGVETETSTVPTAACTSSNCPLISWSVSEVTFRGQSGMFHFKNQSTNQYMRIIRSGGIYSIDCAGGGGKFTYFWIHHTPIPHKLQARIHSGLYLGINGENVAPAPVTDNSTDLTILNPSGFTHTVQSIFFLLGYEDRPKPPKYENPFSCENGMEIVIKHTNGHFLDTRNDGMRGVVMVSEFNPFCVWKAIETSEGVWQFENIMSEGYLRISEDGTSLDANGASEDEKTNFKLSASDSDGVFTLESVVSEGKFVASLSDSIGICDDISKDLTLVILQEE